MEIMNLLCHICKCEKALFPLNIDRNSIIRSLFIDERNEWNGIKWQKEHLNENRENKFHIIIGSGKKASIKLCYKVIIHNKLV